MITKAKNHIFSLIGVALLLAVLLPCSQTFAATNLSQAVAAVKKAVKADPAEAPAILADAIKKNPGGECELTKAAVGALPKGNADLLKKTVEAALKAAGGSSETIAECARQAASWEGAEAAIDQAVASAGGGEGGAGQVPIAVGGLTGLGFSSAGASSEVTASNP